MPNDTLPDFGRISLERLKLAIDVLLSEQEVLPAPLEAELTLFRDRVECALLLQPADPTATS